MDVNGFTQITAAAGAGNDLAGSAIEVNGAQVVVAAVEGGDAAALRSTADQLKGRFSSAVIVLATAVSQDKVLIVAANIDSSYPLAFSTRTPSTSSHSVLSRR